jgi:hypothetical protein
MKSSARATRKRQATGQNMMDRKSAMRPQQHFAITVEGVLDRRWPAWFDGLEVASETAGRLTIAGAAPDQAALRGLLAGIRDFGLPCCRCAVSTRTEPSQTQVVMPLARRRLLTACAYATQSARARMAIAAAPR